MNLEAYVFGEGIPPDYTFDFEPALFNLQEHRELQASDQWYSFYILDQSVRKVSGTIHFQVSNGVATSPLRAPFGSAEVSEFVPARVLFEFLKFVESKLRSKDVSRIVIKSYPCAYAEAQSVQLQTFLLNLKYSVVTAEIASVIHVDPHASRALHRSEKRKLDKAIGAGLVFKELSDQSLETVYNFIHQCRSEKNYTLSMTFADLRVAVSRFPERYLLFGVFAHDRLAAAAITIRVKKKILYDFYHDHEAAFDYFSPVVLLVEGIYDFCCRNNIEMIDLGTSAVDGQPNFSLLHFKKYLGGNLTTKLTFEKILA